MPFSGTQIVLGLCLGCNISINQVLKFSRPHSCSTHVRGCVGAWIVLCIHTHQSMHAPIHARTQPPRYSHGTIHAHTHARTHSRTHARTHARTRARMPSMACDCVPLTEHESPPSLQLAQTILFTAGRLDAGRFEITQACLALTSWPLSSEQGKLA